MRLFGFDKILVNMAAEPIAEVYVRAWNDNSARRFDHEMVLTGPNAQEITHQIELIKSLVKTEHKASMAKQDDQADPLFETLTTQKWRNRFLAGKKTLSLTHSRHYLNVLGCQMLALESIPENLTYAGKYQPSHVSTFQGIQQLIAMANETIEIASFYWTMNDNDVPVQDPSAWEGEQLFKDLVVAGSVKNITIRIVQSKPERNAPVNDTLYLAKYANADVRTIDFAHLFGRGILHTKMWLVDRKHFYVGSANLDWRSFTQVKEMGATIQQCSCLAADMGKIFDAYWYLAVPDAAVPSTWNISLTTAYNADSPMVVDFNGTNYQTYLSSSPPPLCPAGREKDGDASVRIINESQQYIHIAVMDYYPTTQFVKPRTYWPVIDDAIRAAAFNRRVQVRLLVSYWNHTYNEMFLYLHSLQDLQTYTRFLKINIQVKLFVVPAYTDAQRNIPYSRVNHNKYMVTEKTAYIGTSNWSGDYFLTTGGIGLVIHGSSLGNHSDIRQQLEDVFQRDWYSEHAFSLDHFNTTMS